MDGGAVVVGGGGRGRCRPEVHGTGLKRGWPSFLAKFAAASDILTCAALRRFHLVAERRDPSDVWELSPASFCGDSAGMFACHSERLTSCAVRVDKAAAASVPALGISEILDLYDRRASDGLSPAMREALAAT